MTERPRPTDSIHPRGIVPPYMLEHIEATQDEIPPDPTQELIDYKKDQLRQMRLEQIARDLGRLIEQMTTAEPPQPNEEVKETGGNDSE